jgi:hypothetical protein
MTKLARQVNVLASMSGMAVGDSITFPKKTNEMTIRCTATRVKNTTGGVIKVNKQSDGTLIATRIN